MRVPTPTNEAWRISLIYAAAGIAWVAATGWLAAACVPLTLLVARAFERFDVARDTPA